MPRSLCFGCKLEKVRLISIIMWEILLSKITSTLMQFLWTKKARALLVCCLSIKEADEGRDIITYSDMWRMSQPRLNRLNTSPASKSCASDELLHFSCSQDSSLQHILSGCERVLTLACCRFCISWNWDPGGPEYGCLQSTKFVDANPVHHSGRPMLGNQPGLGSSVTRGQQECGN